VEGLRKDGGTFPLHLAVSRVELEDATFFVGLVQDISERKAAEEKIKKMAHYDHLTSLPNRALFNDRLLHEVAVARRNTLQMALMFIDLDGFKGVNDSLGHQAGDQLLQEVAQRLRSSLREADTVARLGGDEFAVILSGLEGQGDVANKAKEIIKSLSAPYPDVGESCRIGCSIGIAMFPDDTDDQETLLNYADASM